MIFTALDPPRYLEKSEARMGKVSYDKILMGGYLYLTVPMHNMERGQ